MDQRKFTVIDRETGDTIATNLSETEVVVKYAPEGVRSASSALLRYLSKDLLMSFGPEFQVIRTA